MYYFTLAELVSDDLQDMSAAVNARRDGIFWENVIVVRYFEIEGEDGLGRLVLDQNTVKRGVGANSEVLAEFRTERERVAAVKKYFGIEIPEEDIKNVQGRGAALPLE